MPQRPQLTIARRLTRLRSRLAVTRLDVELAAGADSLESELTRIVARALSALDGT